MKTPKEVIETFWNTVQTNDFAKVSLLLAEDYVLHYPQSNETMQGRDSFVRLMNNYPTTTGRWQFTVHQIVAEGSQVVSNVTVTDGMTTGRTITFSTIENGLILRQLEFWPDPFGVPEWRRAWTQND